KRNGPNFSVNYQWLRNRNASTQTGLMPTQAQRDSIPAVQISPQASALLSLYPLPNFSGNSRYNYQIPLVGSTHQDSLQARMQKQVKKNQYSGVFGMQSTRNDNTNLFAFLDTNRSFGVNSQLNWRHTFTPRAFVNFGVQFSRFSSQNLPYFSNRLNVAGAAGITGNNQEPINWGPPSLSFASGIS